MIRLFYVSILIVAFSALAFGHAAGMGASNYTNSPPDNHTCIACHSGHTLNDEIGVLSIGGLPSNGYVPGQSYNIIVTLSRGSMYRWGLQQTTQLVSSSTTGGGHLTSSNNYVSATSGGTGPDYANQTTAGTFAGTQNGPVTWNVTWQAPTAGSGTVLFYTVGLACNNNSSTSGDYCYARRDSVREVLNQLPPNQFSLLTPLNGGFVASGPVWFTWAANGDPNPGDLVTYKLFWSLDSTFFNFDSSTNVFAGSIHLDTFALGHSYFWKVRATDNHGNARWSMQSWAFDFNVQRPPEPFALISPANDTGVTALPVVFRWQNTVDLNPGDTVTYTLLKSSLWDGVLRDTLYRGSDTTFTWNGAVLDTFYHWSVTASDQHGNIMWADSIFTFVYFTPTNPTGTISLLTPANNSSVTTSMNLFSWTGITDPDPGDTPSYTIWLKQGNDSSWFFARTDHMLVVTLADMDSFRWNVPVTWWVVGHTQYPPTNTFSQQRFSLMPVNAVENNDVQPSSLQLGMAYPNPFNSTTHLLLTIPHSAPVSGTLYNIAGQAVSHFDWGVMGEGTHNLSIQGNGLTSGRYLLQCRVGSRALSQSFILLK